MIRDAPGVDADGQRRAVRFDTAHTIAMGASRAFWWPPPIVLPLTIGTAYWLEGLAVCAFCALAIVGLYRVAGHARDEVRLLDSTVGIPLPDDMVAAVAAGGSAMEGFKELHDLGVDDIVMADKLRPHVRQLRRFDQVYVRLLHDARRHWVRGDVAAWRDTAGRLPVVAGAVAQLLDRAIAPEP